MILEIPQRKARAFTLIEVLIAITIFAVLLAAINGLFYGAMHLQIKTTDAIDEGLPAEHAATIIKRDIEGVVLSGTNSVLAGQTTSGANSGIAQTPEPGIKGVISLELYTSTGVISDDLPWGDIQKVDYSLEAPTNRMSQGRDLVRSVTRNLLPTTTPEVSEQQRLLYNVQKLQVSFYDGTNWTETWGSTDTNYVVPTAIRFQINMTPDQPGPRGAASTIEWLFPVPVSVTLTNLTTS